MSVEKFYSFKAPSELNSAEAEEDKNDDNQNKSIRKNVEKGIDEKIDSTRVESDVSGIETEKFWQGAALVANRNFDSSP